MLIIFKMYIQHLKFYPPCIVFRFEAFKKSWSISCQKSQILKMDKLNIKICLFDYANILNKL